MKKIKMQSGRTFREDTRYGIKIRTLGGNPEMVSEDSDLYRAHPDWALQIPGKNPVRSRNQLVLDFQKDAVDLF